MAKYLRDLQMYFAHLDDERRKECALSTNSLELLYLDSLPKVRTNGVPKVTIKVCQKPTRTRLDVVLYNPEMLELSKAFDFDAYWGADKESRKRIALDFLQDGLLTVARARGWDTEPFKVAYKTVLAKNFVNYRPWTKSVTSPNRKYKAQVWCNYDSDKAEIFVVIFRRKEVVTKKRVATVQPGDVWIREITGKLQWVSPTEVKLTTRDGKKSWNVQVKEKKMKQP